MDEMMLIIYPTPRMVRVNGAPCRVWAGVTNGGREVDVFVRGIGTSDPDAQAELDRASVDHGGLLWTVPVCIARDADDRQNDTNGVH